MHRSDNWRKCTANLINFKTRDDFLIIRRSNKAMSLLLETNAIRTMFRCAGSADIHGPGDARLPSSPRHHQGGSHPPIQLAVCCLPARPPAAARQESSLLTPHPAEEQGNPAPGNSAQRMWPARPRRHPPHHLPEKQHQWK